MDGDGQQPDVLAHNVEVMEGPKGWIPSFVRFEIFDDVSFLGGEGLYEFTPFIVPGSEGLLAGSDRKVRIVNHRLAVARGKCSSQKYRGCYGWY